MIHPLEHIRNFCVISHIDHGKTTLTDRFLEICQAVSSFHMQPRLLDSNPIEKERGVTIKLAPVRLNYSLKLASPSNDSIKYLLNLIDTPGHVDFSYEVSRSLAACEGAILLVDATQGIQAQTMANANLAIENNLDLIPVINKIDVPIAQIEKVSQQLQETFAFKASEIVSISAKTGQNVIQLIKVIINRLSPPTGSIQKPLKALVFNSFYHPHKGVIVALRLLDGQLHPQDQLQLLATQAKFSPLELGYFTPSLQPAKILSAGEVGYLATGLKDISLCQVGDTLTLNPKPRKLTPLSGYQEPKPMVYLDLFPILNKDFINLKQALVKLQLVDSSLQFKPVNSPVLGSGFNIGFQGLFHADITKERLEREFNLELIATSPSVEYQVELKKNKQLISIINPSQLPETNLINQIREPYIKLTLYTPLTYLGNVLKLCQNFQAKLINQEFFGQQVKLNYHMPLRELISGFFNKLKSVSSGFASLNWEFLKFKPSNIVKLQVLINRRPIEPLAALVKQSQAQAIAKKLAIKLKATIPPQQFEVPIQITLNNRILARQTIKALRKDVTAKLYGGDQTRKDKLLKKQKKGKKRLKQIGKITLSQETFLALLDTS